MTWRKIDDEQEPDTSALLRDVGQALMRGGFVLAEALKEAPPKKTKHLTGPLPGGFYSARQRRKVLGGIRAGTIQVPYLRTGNLARSWSVSRPAIQSGRLTVYVFSDPGEAPYNRMVQDESVRPEMHSDWPSVRSVAQARGDQAMKEVENALEKWGFK